jgi:hypothetical protein
MSDKVEKKDGYVVVTRDDEMQKLRDQYCVPSCCRACGNLMFNWDNKYFYKNGVCCECTINWIEGRDLPEDVLKSRDSLVKYVLDCIQQKKISENS